MNFWWCVGRRPRQTAYEPRQTSVLCTGEARTCSWWWRILKLPTKDVEEITNTAVQFRNFPLPCSRTQQKWNQWHEITDEVGCTTAGSGLSIVSGLIIFLENLLSDLLLFTALTRFPETLLRGNRLNKVPERQHNATQATQPKLPI